MELDRIEQNRIAVLGGGPFGLMVTSLLAIKGREVKLWYPDRREAARLAADRTGRVMNQPFRLNEGIDVVSGFSDFKAGAWTMLVVVPSRQFEESIEHILDHLDREEPHVVIVMTKGLVSKQTRKRHGIHTFSQFIELVAEKKGLSNLRVAVLNGPSLLGEIYASHYTFFNLGCRDQTILPYVKGLLARDFIHVAGSEDVLGVELGGVLKNPIAIACGIGEGLPQSGSNLQGVLLAQGFKEAFRFATMLGAQPGTMMGISGLADLVTTSISPNSRNRGYGARFVRKLLQKENDPGFFERMDLFLRPSRFIEKEVMESHDLVEGAFAISPVLEIADEEGVRLPLFQTLYNILLRKRKPDALIRMFGGSLAAGVDQSAMVAERPTGLHLTAGHNFRTLIENRIFHHITGEKGMLERIRRQAPNVEKNLARRLTRARKKKNRREVESLPKEIELWKKLNAAASDDVRVIIQDLINFYVSEISDNYNPVMRGSLIRTLAPARFLGGGMTSGAAIPFVGGRVEELKSLAERYNILYAPVHRSHLDSVEVAFGLSWKKLPVPRYAAGINLMQSPLMSWVLKSLGAYAVDRERTRNFLYLECLTRYSTMMLEVGIPSLVYPEGTRSREGGINAIKTGLLSTAVDAYLSSGNEIMVVPIALSYENVPEDLEFGDARKSTDFKQFVRTRSKVYMDICEPIRISQHMHEEHPTETIAFHINQQWKKWLRVLPNQIVARLLCENDHSIPVADLPGLIEDFLQSVPGNYLTRNAREIMKQGTRVLRGRGFARTKKKTLETNGEEMKPLIAYYASMTPQDKL